MLYSEPQPKDHMESVRFFSRRASPPPESCAAHTPAPLNAQILARPPKTPASPTPLSVNETKALLSTAPAAPAAAKFL
jgi:hypothetical protein